MEERSGFGRLFVRGEPVGLESIRRFHSVCIRPSDGSTCGRKVPQINVRICMRAQTEDGVESGYGRQVRRPPPPVFALVRRRARGRMQKLSLSRMNQPRPWWSGITVYDRCAVLSSSHATGRHFWPAQVSPDVCIRPGPIHCTVYHKAAAGPTAAGNHRQW